MRHTLSWMAMSMRIEMKMAKAKAAPIWAVKVAVCVMNPGPIAEVAMRKIAPRIALRLTLTEEFADWCGDRGEPDGGGSCDCDIGVSKLRGLVWCGSECEIEVTAVSVVVRKSEKIVIQSSIDCSTE